MSLGTYLLYLRARKGVSPAEVAQATGLPVGHILALEWDKHRSNRATRGPLARYYGVRPWTLARIREYSWGRLSGLVKDAAAKGGRPVTLVMHNGLAVTGQVLGGDASSIRVQQGERLLIVQRCAVREWQEGDETDGVT